MPFNFLQSETTTRQRSSDFEATSTTLGIGCNVVKRFVVTDLREVCNYCKDRVFVECKIMKCTYSHKLCRRVFRVTSCTFPLCVDQLPALSNFVGTYDFRSLSRHYRCFINLL
jgi:hypothetical protein